MAAASFLTSLFFMFFHGSLSLYSTFFCYLLFVFLQSVACFHMGQCCPIMFSLCASNIDRACHRATVVLFAVRLQPVPASGEKLQKVLRYKPQ